MTSPALPVELKGHKPAAAWLVLGVGVLAYILTVMQRTSLGVVGLDAANRFDVSPGSLSAFVFIQVAVYLAAQIPAGIMVDRFGARAMLVASGVLLSAGQLVLAFAATMPAAIPARILVGIGDALVFACVMALIPRWFATERVPVITQLTTILGQIGQILSAVPFAALVHGAGWTPAFGSAAAASALIAVLVFIVVRNAPGDEWAPGATTSASAVTDQLREVWRRPGTRLGFFGHMGTQFSMMVFGLLWGVPYLVSAQHLSATTAGGLISLFVLCALVVGPVIGVLTQQHPLRRSWLLLAVIAADIGIWTVILALPGPAPFWLLVLLIVVLSAGGPGSVVGIDIARTTNPNRNLAVAQCIVNLGGFLATLTTLAAMGFVLTALGGFTPEAFRIAWLVQYPIWVVAIVGVFIARKKSRRLDADRGVVPRPILQVITGRFPHEN